MIVAVPKEVAPGERRVAIVPDGVRALVNGGHEVWVEAGAGESAAAATAHYEKAGARITAQAPELFGAAQVVVKVQPPEPAELAQLRADSALIALLRPLDEPGRARDLAQRGLTAFALELLPRSTRAQAMDVLSSQATVAGYRAVILAAARLPKMFPMLVTAAGTVSPARVFVIGAGVAGLQAIATARRLGAVVEAYDTRAAAAEQIESLGARSISMQPEHESGPAEDEGGYARAQSESFYAAQRKLMSERAARADIVISTALVPGRPAPLLLDAGGVRGMAPGSVVIDLAAANGGNCACTRADEEVLVNGVQVLGPTNLPSDLPADASLMFSKNVVALLQHLAPQGDFAPDFGDEITGGALLARGGEICNARVAAQLESGAAAPGGAG